MISPDNARLAGGCLGNAQGAPPSPVLPFALLCVWFPFPQCGHVDDVIKVWEK